MKFYNATEKAICVKDAGGAVMLGPFLPGTEAKGPWYDTSEISDYYFEVWKDLGKIRVVE
jgi:hypothetical protein